ncbi:hypothetical protein L914_12977 [Phytophthora nicotianae]|uniref:Uncharacterized protein n=1 Tax=Phytophthora nicotianae TaxID=4792 RepID=W2MY76_PHYNI|nr:hypothetical protein L914_12977 [Phytophthora nicotianae]
MLTGTKKRNSGGATSDEDDLLGYLDVAFEREQHSSTVELYSTSDSF